MSMRVTCPQCGHGYDVAESMAGSHVQCRKCQAAFVIQAPVATGPMPTQYGTPPGPQFGAPTGPMGAPMAGPWSTGPAQQGPTDRQFRLGAAVLVPIVGLGMLAALFGMKHVNMGAVTVVGLGPFGIFFGIAALIDPNIVRAAGKFGTHLPSRYKWIAAGVGLAALACSLPLAWLMMSRQ